MGRARSFYDNKEGRTFKEIREMSYEKEVFTVQENGMTDKEINEELEREYWNMVDL